MPPDGPLPKLPNLYIADISNLNFKKKTKADYNSPSFEMDRDSTNSTPEPFSILNQNISSSESGQIQTLKLELAKSKQREQQLRDELLASAKIINEQDELLNRLKKEISDLKNQKNEDFQSPKNFFSFLEDFQKETNRLSAETEAMFRDNIKLETPSKDIFGNRSPSLDEIENSYREDDFLEGTFS
eukprot:CAMPEP_0202943740 /NCGR_PEP_ID=MMETSP1395-20130829/4285_1 /ASSEMBLY_ACC=CAM_ASM_000871 /TAXON_ID=5961 /ORGANISM="Blepharisma japonicum, Strain Stock R1072" /LENGTH=185 /DNA_ID=CAMNT_0049641595 /DNA_START=150 /DNA_END=703 /DNA_ORIENTATION=+